MVVKTLLKSRGAGPHVEAHYRRKEMPKKKKSHAKLERTPPTTKKILSWKPEIKHRKISSNP